MSQLNIEIIEGVIEEYVEQFIPAMMEFKYHLTLVKGGPDYPHLSEQSHFSHIVNGVFSLTELMKFIVTTQIMVPGLNETTFRKALALFSIHEVHKADDYEKIDHTEFSIPLQRLRQEYDALGLNSFARVDEHMMRQANVHKRSYRHGDRLLSNAEDSSLVYLLTRIADTFASVKSPSEAVSSLAGYLRDLGPAFSPNHVQLYYHELRDIRGVLTNTLHQSIAQQLHQQFGAFPLLYFATGTLYITQTTARGDFEIAVFVEEIVTKTLGALTAIGSADTSAVKSGIRSKKYDFEKFVYSFATVPTLLQVVQEETQVAKPDAKLANREIDSLVAKREELSTSWRDNLERNYGIQLSDNPEHKTFNEHWSLARRYLLYVDTILRDLNPEGDRLEWFLNAFDIPEQVADNLRAEAGIWARGGIGKYVLVMAFHFLHGDSFSDRAAESLPPERVIERLHRHVLAKMAQLDTHKGREAAVAELGFRHDLLAYLHENLHLSFHPALQLEGDSLADYVKPKKKGHSREVCSLCNRNSPYVQDLRTGILDDFGRVFSNRVIPAPKAPGMNRPWCPICHLEFTFRKLIGLGLPSGAHYKNSYHMFLYVLPTYSFTPEHVRLFGRFLITFKEPTGLPVRDYGRQDWGLPRYWLEKRQLDPEWIDQVFEAFEKQAAKISNWGGRRFVGEQMVIGQAAGQPHYYLIKWAKPARDTEQDDERIATRTEAWAKAILAAAVITGLTGCKVYVTERPYLPLTDPADVKATIHLDSPPPSVRGLLGEEGDTLSLYGRELGNLSGLERVLDLSTALWTVTVDVHPPQRKTKDKYIADRLGTLNVNELAGAHFYKEYARLNEGATPYKPLVTACQVLLEIRGGELMNLVEEISQAALAVRLPLRGQGRGKMHNYELAFREAMDALRKSFPLIPELRQTALTGEPPSFQAKAELKDLASGTLLKAMERRLQTRRGDGVINPFGGDLNQLTRNLIDILIDKVYLGRASGSFTAFMRLENSLADGVYYYTDRNLSNMWQKRKEMQETKEQQ